VQAVDLRVEVVGRLAGHHDTDPVQPVGSGRRPGDVRDRDDREERDREQNGEGSQESHRDPMLTRPGSRRRWAEGRQPRCGWYR
jgi:hypothetical protein